MKPKDFIAATASLSKIAYINITLVVIIFLLPSLALSIRRAVYKAKPPVDNRSTFPVYKSKQEGIDIWSDIRGMYLHSPKDYQAIGWRNKPYKGNTVFVDGKYNTRIGIGHEISNSTWFFGGSTMWGFGVGNNHTVPSFFSELTGESSANFGEWSWQSRQSVNQLLTLIADGERPSTVIFYDGVNDAWNQCFSDQDVFSPIHSETSRIRNLLSERKGLTSAILEPFYLVLNRVIQNHSDTFYENKCVNENKYSRSVAKHLVENWYLVHLLSKSHGFVFKAILQPNLHTTKLKESAYVYFDNVRKLEAERASAVISSVYPWVREFASQKCDFDKDFCNSFVDGSSFLAGTSSHFIDWNHLASEGNRAVASKIVESLKVKSN